MPRLAGTAALLVWLGAWALALGLHLLRERRRRVLVPFMPLWDALLVPESTTRLFRRLRRFGSLLIAFVVSGLLVLALSDPEGGAWRGRQRSTLLLIDRGQTMQASDRRAPARRAALQLLAAASPNDSILVAQLDAVVTPRSTFTDDRAQLKRAFEQLTDTDAATDLAAGVRFARRVLRGRPNPKLILISDGAFGASPALAELDASGVAFEQVRVGSLRRNLGIRAFSARRYPWDRAQSELLLTLENAGDQLEPIELTLLSDGVPIAITPIELAAHSVISRSYAAVPAQAERLEARIDARGPAGPDALPNDDRAFATLPTSAPLRVLLVSNGDRFVEAALLLDRSHEVHTVSPSAYRSAAGYDLVVFEACVPNAPPTAPALYLAPPKNDRNFPFAVRGEVARPYFEHVVPDEALLRDLALRDVNIGKMLALELQPGDRALAMFQRAPLIVLGERAHQPFVALSFDVRDSDLPLRIAWPLLVTQAIDHLVTGDSDYRAALEVGTEQRIALTHPGGSAAARARIVDPSGHALELEARDGSLIFRPERAGFYRLETSSELQLLAANRPAKSLAIAPHALRPARVVARSSSGWPADAWQLALLLAWAITSLEWFGYERRWTA
ncbi:MAG TPA: VWA domain-containing protein [Polyangiales bacterium]|jgi:hypothetical protein